MWGKTKTNKDSEGNADNRDHKMSTNKIINNDYYSKEIDMRSITFAVDPHFQSKEDMVDQLHSKMILEDIKNVLKGHKFEAYVRDYNVKLKKAQINEVYAYITKRLPKYKKKDLFAYIAEYFDIDYTKFFNSLSNMFKEELMSDISNSSYYTNKNIKQLF